MRRSLSSKKFETPTSFPMDRFADIILCANILRRNIFLNSNMIDKCSAFQSREDVILFVDLILSINMTRDRGDSHLLYFNFGAVFTVCARWASSREEEVAGVAARTTYSLE